MFVGGAGLSGCDGGCRGRNKGGETWAWKMPREESEVWKGLDLEGRLKTSRFREGAVALHLRRTVSARLRDCLVKLKRTAFFVA